MSRHYGLKARTIEVKSEWTWRDAVRLVWHRVLDGLKVVLRFRQR